MRESVEVWIVPEVYQEVRTQCVQGGTGVPSHC